MIPPVVTIANMKGGVGKTTTTLGLASAMRRFGYRVLVLDMDPQANSTDVLLRQALDEGGFDGPGIIGITADATGGGGYRLDEVIVPADEYWSGVDIVPGSIVLSNVESDSNPSQVHRLRRAFRTGAEHLSPYDLVLIDCPPSIGRILVAALVASSWVLIVTEPGSHSVDGIGKIEESMQTVREDTERDTPQLGGVLINRWRRSNEHDFQVGQVRQHYGNLVLPAPDLIHRHYGQFQVPPYIGERTGVGEAVSRGEPIHNIKGGGAPSVARVFDFLAADVVVRFGMRRLPALDVWRDARETERKASEATIAARAQEAEAG